MLFAACAADAGDSLPAEIFGLKLEKKLTGQQAVDFINKLHMKTVAAEENEIGFYRGEKGEAVIYVTKYNNEADAEKYYRKMTKRISPERSPFMKGDYRNILEREVYTTFGMGQTHYVFADGAELFWISAGTMWAEDFLNAYLKYLGSTNSSL